MITMADFRKSKVAEPKEIKALLPIVSKEKIQKIQRYNDCSGWLFYETHPCTLTS